MDFVNRLRHTYDDNEDSLHNLIEWYGRFQVLALDDLGLERPTPFAQEQLTDYVDASIMWSQRLVVVTNLPKDEMRRHYGDWGERMASRLYGTAQNEVQVAFALAPDHRDSGDDDC